jgi:hypothetical protein
VKVALFALGGVFGLLGLLVFATSFYTAGKLERGRMVRGEIPGAVYFVGVVEASVPREGRANTSTGGKFPDQCELAVRVTIDGAERTVTEWMTSPDCDGVSIGSSVEIARVPGDSSLYLKNGTWASVGNRALDEKFLLGERAIGSGLFALALLLALGGALSRGARAAPRNGALR